MKIPGKLHNLTPREQASKTLGREDMLTVREAAKYLHVVPQTLRKWIRAGKFPHHRYPNVGGPRPTIRISWDQLEAFNKQYVIALNTEDWNPETETVKRARGDPEVGTAGLT